MWCGVEEIEPVFTMPVTELKRLTERAERAWDALRYAEAYFSFDALDEEGGS